MQLYTIMDADLSHIDEICADVKRQYDEGIANCALFFAKLVPEGVPAIDKAGLFAERYIPFRDRLRTMGIECGILVQCTIGHGYVLDHPFGFTTYKRLTDGGEDIVVCPYDLDARKYFREQFLTLAKLEPKAIMLDDDFRLMYRSGKGCACELHMAAIEKRYGKKIERAQIASIVMDRNHPENKLITDIFVDTQRESITDLAREIRAGIDTVDPKIPGIVCGCGYMSEFHEDIAKIMAGEGNPSTVRINNGNYHPTGARYFAYNMYRLALQKNVLNKHGVEVILAETDTCPHNRYSTSAQTLHAHFTGSIIEGASGAKHWITRLFEFQPASGEAYRRKLGKFSGFYNALSDFMPKVKRFGCRIPLPSTLSYGLHLPGWPTLREAWSDCVLERLGVPIYYSAEPGGATFLDGDPSIFTDEEILDMLKGTLFISSNSAEALEKRGFGQHLGVTVRAWSGANPSYERIVSTSQKSPTQVGVKELVPTSDKTVADSIVYHLKDGKEEIPLFPAVTVYDNELGGRAICFSGTPKAKYVYFEAFSMLNEERKAEFERLLGESGNLPIMYRGDEEVYLTAGTTDEGEMFTGIFNIGLDPIDEINLRTGMCVTQVRALSPDGKWESAEFSATDGGITVKKPLYTLEPVILLIK